MSHRKNPLHTLVRGVNICAKTQQAKTASGAAVWED